MAAALRTSVPPTGIRQCSGQTFHPAVGAYAGSPRRDAHQTPCVAGATVWVPEVGYCWAHLPAEWRLVAERRRALWAERAPSLWAEICEEIPAP